MRFVIVTGLSGAGKTTALKVLEDLDFFCVDNLPCVLLNKFADLCFQGKTEFSRVAVGIDVRSREFFGQLEAALGYLDTNHYNYEVLYVYADEDVLVNRYNFTRRAHPLAVGGQVIEGIRRETEMLARLKNRAAYLLDTSAMQPKDMQKALMRIYNEHGDAGKTGVNLISFGFKRGIPLDADFVFDVRFLPNPYNIDTLRNHSGLEKCVVDYLNGFEQFTSTLDYICNGINAVLPYYAHSGKHEMLIAIGCTGGYHRSVAMVHAIHERLTSENISVNEAHRDLNTELLNTEKQYD